LKIKENITSKMYLEKLAKNLKNSNDPIVVVQKINTEHPWCEFEKIPEENEMRGRYSAGPSYLEIFKQYIKASGERMQLYRFYYYAFRKVFYSNSLVIL